MLATDVATVLTGVLIGIAATVLVGFAVFSLERKLPQKKMLMLTGLMVTWVLVVMVGTTVQIMQTVGWLPVTPDRRSAPAVLVGRLVRRLPDLGRRAAPARAPSCS